MTLWDLFGRCELTFELLLFEMVFSRTFVRRKNFLPRFAAGTILCFTGTILMVMRTKNMWGSILPVMVIFLLSMLLMMLCFENRLSEIFFVCVTAYVSQIILYSAFIILNTILPEHGRVVTGILYSVLLFIFVLLLNRLFGSKIDFSGEVKVDEKILIFLFLTAWFLDTVFKFYLIDQNLGVESGGIFLHGRDFPCFAVF